MGKVLNFRRKINYLEHRFSDFNVNLQIPHFTLFSKIPINIVYKKIILKSQPKRKIITDKLKICKLKNLINKGEQV